jgi:hypothetical protein
LFGKRSRIVAVGLVAVVLAATGAAQGAHAAALPTVTRLSASSGSPAGGETLTITGKNFVKVTAVKFGATKAKTLKVLSKTKLQVTVPAHAAGKVDVRVTTKTATSSIVKADKYTFANVKTTAYVKSVAPYPTMSFPVKVVAGSKALTMFPAGSITITITDYNAYPSPSSATWTLASCAAGCIPTLNFATEGGPAGIDMFAPYQLTLNNVDGQVWVGPDTFQVVASSIQDLTAVVKFSAPGYVPSTSACDGLTSNPAKCPGYWS